MDSNERFARLKERTEQAAKKIATLDVLERSTSIHGLDYVLQARVFEIGKQSLTEQLTRELEQIVSIEPEPDNAGERAENLPAKQDADLGIGGDEDSHR